LLYEQLAKARLVDLRTAYAGIENDTGPQANKDKAILRYHIAEQSADYDAMGKVVDRLDALHEADPTDAEITAYLGSAYTLRARDYPWQGLYQVIPGPGFVRLGYTGKGVDLLDKAVTQDDRNPVVRLIRGITFTHMPRPFGEFDTGLTDLVLLRNWIESPNIDTQQTVPRLVGKLDRGLGDSSPSRSQNEILNVSTRYAAMLKDPAFRGDVYFRLAEAYELDGNETGSRKFFARAAEVAPPGSPIAIAARQMAQ